MLGLKKYSKDTMKQADELIRMMRRANVPAFHIDTFGLLGRENVHRMIEDAKRLHRLAEHECNGVMTDNMRKTEARIESVIRDTAHLLGLNVSFSGDPRGYVVKLHAPNGDVYNTWGGSESGYGIG